MKIPEKMKWKAGPIQLNKNKTKWAYRDKKFISIHDDVNSIKISLAELKKILRAK